MARWSRLWRNALTIFALINVAGLIIALVGGEMMHATVHALLLAGTLVAWQTSSSQPRQAEQPASIPQLDSQLDHLQQSVDAIALEVERIGEAQRFAAKIIQKDAEQKRPE